MSHFPATIAPFLRTGLATTTTGTGTAAGRVLLRFGTGIVLRLGVCTWLVRAVLVGIALDGAAMFLLLDGITRFVDVVGDLLR